jgi:predicted nucleic acid-binding protein
VTAPDCRFVLDSSVTMAWCFDDECDAFADGVLARLAHEAAIVPPLWPLEVANVLAIGERRGRLTPAASTRFVELLASLPLVVAEQSSGPAFDAILPLARATGLSAYDAAYLELAMRHGLPLATLDARLRAAAESLGVALV